MCCRRIRTQSEWKVQVVGRSSEFRVPRSAFRVRGSSCRTRSCISRAALFREGHAENISRRHAFADHVRDAERDDARLARAGARQVKTGPSIVSTACRCCGLRECESTMRARSVVSVPVNASGLPRFDTANRRKCCAPLARCA